MATLTIALQIIPILLHRQMSARKNTLVSFVVCCLKSLHTYCQQFTSYLKILCSVISLYFSYITPTLNNLQYRNLHHRSFLTVHQAVVQPSRTNGCVYLVTWQDMSCLILVAQSLCKIQLVLIPKIQNNGIYIPYFL